MNLERTLIHTAVYWGSPVSDGYGGFTFADPVELSVRWLDRQEVIRGADYRQEVSRAVVLAAVDLEEGGMIAHMALMDLESNDSPQANGAYVIRAVSKVADIKGTISVRKAYVG